MKEQLLTLMDGQIDVAGLKVLLPRMNTADIAEVFGELGKEKAIQIFRMLPKSIAADVFSYIDADEQQIIIEALTDSEIGEIINSLFADDAVDFIEEMPANVVKHVLQNVNPEKRTVINQLLRYPDDSAGSIMTTEYVDHLEDVTVREACDAIRATGLNRETLYNCEVIRRDRMLVGVVSAKTLMLAKPHERIGDVMDTKLVFAQTTDDQEKVAGLFKK
ncbi:MAG: magnesium transporter, partial [Treponema sp.]|nr:magnesium transporter [Treponema sp.]